MLEEGWVAGVLLDHAIELSARRREKIGRRGTAIECGEGDERFGAVRVNFGCRKIARRGVARARVQRVLEIAHPRRHERFCLRAGDICGIAFASKMRQRMRAPPDKPAEKDDHKNRNGDLRVRGHRNGAATVTAMMVLLAAASTAMAMAMLMRAAGRGLGSQVEDLWQTILVQETENRARGKWIAAGAADAR